MNNYEKEMYTHNKICLIVCILVLVFGILLGYRISSKTADYTMTNEQAKMYCNK